MKNLPMSVARGLVLATALAFAIPSAVAASSPRVFPHPEDAAEALVKGLKTQDRNGVLGVLGSASRDWILSGDRPTDKARWERFVAAYDEDHSVVEREEGRAVLIVGKDRHPFAFPIVRVPGGWRFDPAQGREEVLNRLVGENELSTIEVLKEVVAAQREFILMDRDGDNVREYAGRFISSPGKHDGLFWPTAEGEAPSPLGPLVVEAQAQGYGKASSARAFHGYKFKMLEGQTAAAPGGAQDYRVNGKNAGGFAVLAFPARYGISGVKSFIVNQEGAILERDLGAKTADAAAKMKRFDPNSSWQKTAAAQ
ncbi:DUF2950 domain-containing protein [Niveibacterium sp. SC-1]|uniref:DUF2950 domain-containing protein n=1 Tax=Niveibacterium sp. SC-1 TaxID=3135646 RepID=UPI00311F1007